jgi:hypothetical protein
MGLFSVAVGCGVPLRAWSAPLAGSPVQPTTASPACPQTLEPLVKELLVDLPTYANRENIRTNRLRAYVMLATPPEFKPLPPAEVQQTLRPPPSDPAVHQVFFYPLATL